jgi:hypothetical protein
VGEIARSSKWCPVQRLGATTEEPKAMEYVGVEQLEFCHFFSPGQVMLGAHLGLHLASVVDGISIQHQVPDCAPPTSPVTAFKWIL